MPQQPGKEHAVCAVISGRHASHSPRQDFRSRTPQLLEVLLGVGSTNVKEKPKVTSKVCCWAIRCLSRRFSQNWCSTSAKCKKHARRAPAIVGGVWVRLIGRKTAAPPAGARAENKLNLLPGLGTADIHDNMQAPKAVGQQNRTQGSEVVEGSTKPCGSSGLLADEVGCRSCLSQNSHKQTIVQFSDTANCKMSPLRSFVTRGGNICKGSLFSS